MNMTAQVVGLVLVEEIANAYLADEEPSLEELEALWTIYRMLRRQEAGFETVAADLPRRVQRDMLRKLSGVEEPEAVLLTEALRGQQRLRLVEAR